MAEELKACDQRKAFEAAILAANGQVPGNYNPEYDRYVSERRQGQYEGWKLARAQLHRQGGEAVGYVMTDAEYLRTDGRAGRVLWFGELTPGAKLYTHPADQVAEPANQIAWKRRDGVMGCKRFMTQKVYDAQSPEMKGNYEPFYCAHCKAEQVAEGVVVSRELMEMEWLEQWLLAAEPVGQECCNRPGLECCGSPVPVYRTADEIAIAMNARREELRALLEVKP